MPCPGCRLSLWWMETAPRRLTRWRLRCGTCTGAMVSAEWQDSKTACPGSASCSCSQHTQAGAAGSRLAATQTWTTLL
jgi:hypothetical protein